MIHPNHPTGSGEAPLPLLRHEQHVLEPEQPPIAGPPDSSGLQCRDTVDVPWFFAFGSSYLLTSRYFMILVVL